MWVADEDTLYYIDAITQGQKAFIIIIDLRAGKVDLLPAPDVIY